MNWASLPQAEGLFATERMKPVVNENIEAEMLKLAISNKFPGRMELALAHQAANKFGISKPLDTQMCACCDQRINNIKLTRRADLQRVNSPTGIVLVFSFIKMVTFYMLLQFIVSGFYNMYTNLRGNECENLVLEVGVCNKRQWLLLSSPVNKLSQVEEFRRCSILNLVFVFVSIVYFIYYRKLHLETHLRASERVQSQDQYSLFITNIPNVLKDSMPISQQKVRDCLNKVVDDWKTENQNSDKPTMLYQSYIQATKLKKNYPQKSLESNIVYVHLCWDQSEITSISTNKENLMNQVESLAQGLVDSKSHKPSFDVALKRYKEMMPLLKQRLSNVDQELLEVAREYSIQERRSSQFYITHFIGKAFVVFQYQHFVHAARNIIKEGKTMIDNNVIEAEWASHPRDIYWQNLNISQKVRHRREVVSLAILLGTVLFSYAVCIGIQYAGQVFKPKEIFTFRSIGLYEVTINQATNFVIFMVNYILFNVMTALAGYQKHQTRTYEENSLLWKVLVSQFINSAMIFVVIHFISKAPMWDGDGIIFNAASVVITGALTDVLIKGINYGYNAKKFHLWWNYRKGPLEQPKFQIRLNHDFEWPQFDLADYYTGYINLVYVALFFSMVCPLGVFVTSACFGIQYLIDKITLVRMSSVKKDYNFLMSRESLKMLELSLLIFASGNLFFEILLSRVSFFTIIALVVSFIFAGFSRFLPFKIESRLLSQSPKCEDLSYFGALDKGMLEQTYNNKDPATRFTSRNYFDRSRDYCTLQNAQKWLNEKDSDQAAPYPPFNPKPQQVSLLP